MEVRIGKLNTEKFELCQDFERKEGEKKELTTKIEELNIAIQLLERDIERQKTELVEREDAMKQM